MASTAVVFLFLVTAVHGFWQIQSCPSGWLQFGNDCYLFGHQKFTFSEAEIFCLQQNVSHLIDVVNDAENEFIRKEMKRQNNGETYWLGMVDEAVEGDWRLTNMGTPMVYTDWYPGQPNVGDSEDCMCAPPYFDYHWGDYNCNDRCCYAICKKSLNAGVLTVVGK